MSEVKITSDMVKPFTGDGDVVAWLKKIQLVGKLKKISDLASLIPLYLEGDALALYLEMSDADQSDSEKIVARLREAFSDGAFVAYAKLVKVRWTGQPVDVYANDIRRLAGLAGFTGVGLENVVRMTFVNGFPDTISIGLQQVSGVLTKPVSELINVARVLCTAKDNEVHRPVAAVATQAQGRPSGYRPRGFKGKCFRCGGPHLIKECEEKVRCYKCNKVGHFANQCENKIQESTQSQGQGNE